MSRTAMICSLVCPCGGETYLGSYVLNVTPGTANSGLLDAFTILLQDFTFLHVTLRSNRLPCRYDYLHLN